MLKSPRLTIVMPTMLQNRPVCFHTNSPTDSFNIRQIAWASSVVEIGDDHLPFEKNYREITIGQHNTDPALTGESLKTRGGGNLLLLDANLKHSSVYSFDKVAPAWADATRRCVSISNNVLNDFGTKRPAITSHDIDLRYTALEPAVRIFVSCRQQNPLYFPALHIATRTTGLKNNT